MLRNLIIATLISLSVGTPKNQMNILQSTSEENENINPSVNKLGAYEGTDGTYKATYNTYTCNNEDYIRIDENQEYRIEYDLSTYYTGIFIFFYDENLNYLGYTDGQIAQSRVITTKDNSRYIRYNSYADFTDLSWKVFIYRLNPNYGNGYINDYIDVDDWTITQSNQPNEDVFYTYSYEEEKMIQSSTNGVITTYPMWIKSNIYTYETSHVDNTADTQYLIRQTITILEIDIQDTNASFYTMKINEIVSQDFATLYNNTYRNVLYTSVKYALDQDNYEWYSYFDRRNNNLNDFNQLLTDFNNTNGQINRTNTYTYSSTVNTTTYPDETINIESYQGQNPGRIYMLSSTTSMVYPNQQGIYIDIRQYEDTTYKITYNLTYQYKIVVNVNYEYINIPEMMFIILGMPFTFLTGAFNLTLFPGTMYQINIGNIFIAILAFLVLLFIIKIIIKLHG